VEALKIVPRVDPELVLLDFRMSGLEGLETSRLLRAADVRAVVVRVSSLGRRELPGQVESSGVAAVLHKSEMSPRRLSALWRNLQLGRVAAPEPA
jgi:DNA-binding NarL/FixJ family response regulator